MLPQRYFLLPPAGLLVAVVTTQFATFGDNTRLRDHVDFKDSAEDLAPSAASLSASIAALQRVLQIAGVGKPAGAPIKSASLAWLDVPRLMGWPAM